MQELIIIDVGHGNSALLISNEQSAVFDVPPKDILLRTINQYGISTIDCLYLSHLDRDHIGGVALLLSNKNLRIKNIFINPDPTKIGPQNKRLRIAVDEVVQRCGTNVHAATVASPSVVIGEVSVAILSPSASDYLMGPGGDDIDGNFIDSNSASVVIKLTHDDHPIALFAADMDQRNLDRIIQRGHSMHADVLVFPHHGGHCASDNVAFTELLLSIVQPQVAFFSMGRNLHTNPRIDIVEAIKRVSPSTYISCSQLSVNCLEKLPSNTSGWEGHLAELPGDGRASRISCFATMRLELEGSSTKYPLAGEAHSKFVQINIPNALCK